ncbi:hypothetical protein RI129_008261 [Pyrocoelia pectoralis]|uniref:Uncharacterized protein n=1 Tax=Pyrocoelia pectoralis TaxID=417401 RepID=A0AAN7VEW1_9COLE
MRILFFILLYTTLIENKIVIKDSGLATISRGDMAMILYVTVENVCENKYHIFVQMIKCCELFGPNDMDCHTMQLIGGDMGWLNSHSVKNISLIYPTLYLHNRFGHCLVSIIYNSSEASVNIQFNTLITQLTPELRDYCGEGNVTVCDTVDLDPLRQCEPINCQMKYLGARNYFNFKWRRCQKVPLCITDRDKSLPDVSYVPFSNQCKDLEQVNLKELQDLQQDNWKSEVPNIRCHHGKLDMDRGFCNCDKGWTTVITDGNHYEPTLSIYHMCNTQIPPQKSPIGYILFAIFETRDLITLHMQKSTAFKSGDRGWSLSNDFGKQYKNSEEKCTGASSCICCLIRRKRRHDPSFKNSCFKSKMKQVSKGANSYRILISTNFKSVTNYGIYYIQYICI